MKKAFTKPLIFATALVLATAAWMPAGAAEVDTNYDTLNQTHQQRTDNMAMASLDPAEHEALESAMGDLQQTRDALRTAQELGDEEAIVQAEDDLRAAESVFSGALADALDAQAEDIATMRADGMGWGQIANELGVHPGTLGLGVGNKHVQQAHERIDALAGEMAQEDAAMETIRTRTRTTTRATERSMQGNGNGLGKGHGLTADGSSAQSNGLGSQKSKSGMGNSGSNGRGGGNSNAGGNGHGGGNGGGNGHGGGNGGGNGHGGGNGKK